MNWGLIAGVRHPARRDWPHRTPVLAFFAAYALVLSSLPVDAFVACDNYLIYAREAGRILECRLKAGWLPTLANEPLWLLFNLALGAVLVSEDVARSLVLLPAAVVAWRGLAASPRDFGRLLLFCLQGRGFLRRHALALCGWWRAAFLSGVGVLVLIDGVLLQLWAGFGP